MPTRTITIHHVNAALHGARRRGLDARPLLHEAGIPPGLLCDTRARVTPEQYTRLFHVLWDVLDDEFAGLARKPSRRGTFAMMCHAIIHRPDLETALRRACAFYALFPEGPRFHLESGPGWARLRLDLAGQDDPTRFLTESLLVIWHRFASWLIGRRIPLRRTEFTFPEPAHAAEYEPMFGCGRAFGCDATAAVFDQRYLSMPVVRDEESLARFLHGAPADLLSRRDYDTSSGAQVRRVLDQGIREGMPALEQVAARLAVSPQTLRRRLHEEGTSFREIKDQLRRDIAITSLASAAGSVEEIGRQLGFSEASAFHRAFKRWTGTTPGAYHADGAHAGTC